MKTRSVVPLVFLVALGLPATAPADIVIPSSAFSSGANQAEFQSDVRIFNPTSSPVNAIPVFYNQVSGETVTKTAITVPARGQLAFDNVLSSLFGQNKGSFGPIRFQTSAPLVVSSSVSNTNGCGNGSTSGQWLPGIDVAQALRSGTLVQLAVSADGASGYRSNIDFVNPGSEAATIVAKVRKGDGTQLSSATIGLGANGFFQKRLDDVATFPGVSGTTDTNLWLEFTSDQPVLAFASVISNASGDPFAIVATPEPVTVVAPVASFSFSPAAPKVGDLVTFTDSSTGSPVQQLWAFGDGGTSTAGGTVTKSFAAAGTFKVSHFVTNSAGAAVLTRDVVVAAVTTGPIDVAVTLKQFAFEPSTLTFTVGQAYRISFRSTDVIHGVGGLAALGITGCNLVTTSTACVANFTPTAGMVSGSPFTMSCSQTSCGAGHNTMVGRINIVNP